MVGGSNLGPDLVCMEFACSPLNLFLDPRINKMSASVGVNSISMALNKLASFCLFVFSQDDYSSHAAGISWDKPSINI